MVGEIQIRYSHRQFNVYRSDQDGHQSLLGTFGTLGAAQQAYPEASLETEAELAAASSGRPTTIFGAIVADPWNRALFTIWVFFTAGFFFSYLPADALRDAALLSVPFGIGIAFRVDRLDALFVRGVEVQARLLEVEVTSHYIGRGGPAKWWQARYYFDLDGTRYFQTTSSEKFWSPGVRQPDPYAQSPEPASFVDCIVLLVDPRHPGRSIFLRSC